MIENALDDRHRWTPGLGQMAELTINGDVFNVEVEGQATKPALVRSNALGPVLTHMEPAFDADHGCARQQDCRRDIGHAKKSCGQPVGDGKPARKSAAKSPAPRRKPQAVPRRPKRRGKS